MKLNRSIKYFSLLLVIFTFVACNENSFTTVVDIDFAEFEPKLTVSSRIILSSSTSYYKLNNLVFVGKSIGINASADKNELTEVKVSLYENGVLIDQGIEEKTGISNWDLGIDSSIAYRLNFTDYKEGNKYMLEVEKEGLPSVNATQKVPEKDTFSFLKFVKDGNTGVDGDVHDEIVFNIENINEDKYYLIEGRYIIKRQGQDTLIKEPLYDDIFLDSDDPFLRSVAYGGLILRGKDVNSGDVNLKAIVSNTWQSHISNGKKLSMNLHTITKEQYLFLLSNTQYQRAEGNPFAEPSEVYSNFENGFGIFSIESVVNKTILIN